MHWKKDVGFTLKQFLERLQNFTKNYKELKKLQSFFSQNYNFQKKFLLCVNANV